MKKFFRKNWIIIAAILYTLLPLDLLPDIIPFFGYSDDLVALLASFIVRGLLDKKDLAQTEDTDKIQEGEIIE